MINYSDAQLDPLLLREYGRNVQNLFRRIQQEPDRVKRTAYIKALVPIMIAVNPQLKYGGATLEKVWHDIFYMADYELDIDLTRPVPEKPTSETNLVTMPYMEGKLKYRRYGRHLLHILEEVKAMENIEYATFILLQMGKWLLNFHRKGNNVDDILYYFKDVTRQDIDWSLLRKQLQDFSPYQKHTKYTQKRYFRKRNKG
ncbi:MAG: DUF4290 domain-containing protein [Bacteroidota bacterium]